MAAMAQRRALAIAPKFSGTLSMIGSTYIIHDVASDRRKRQCVYSRIIFAMSCLDWVVSFWYGLSTWPIPEINENNAPYAVGNKHTCIAQGFFIQLGIGTPMYNTMLALYYLFVIALKWPDHRVQRAEKYMHASVILFAGGAALAGLPLTLYNNATLWCWIASVPLKCATSSKSLTGNCERGNNAWIYRWAFFYAPLWFFILLVTCIMAAVTYFVWTQERASMRFSATRGKGGNKDTLSKQVFWQAIYYVLAFYATWVIPTTLRFLQTIGQPVPYWIKFGMALLTPMQGFLNFLVYVRPRFIKYRTKHPELSSTQIITGVLSKKMFKIMNPTLPSMWRSSYDSERGSSSFQSNRNSYSSRMSRIDSRVSEVRMSEMECVISEFGDIKRDDQDRKEKVEQFNNHYNVNMQNSQQPKDEKRKIRVSFKLQAPIMEEEDELDTPQDIDNIIGRRHCIVDLDDSILSTSSSSDEEDHYNKGAANTARVDHEQKRNSNLNSQVGQETFIDEKCNKQTHSSEPGLLTKETSMDSRARLDGFSSCQIEEDGPDEEIFDDEAFSDVSRGVQAIAVFDNKSKSIQEDDDTCCSSQKEETSSVNFTEMKQALDVVRRYAQAQPKEGSSCLSIIEKLEQELRSKK